ncbi:TetR family transcriptional regulator [Agaribacter marinus]|uniref:TetR family transcriptional regulator n=1 Tax=Virgibacillus salarius TaxID=447199 RepID=A0A941DTH4_9BACI|nr:MULTISPECIES: TetR/AcrR family transcriptional regulator [Bacillaceae]MBR7796884.1 TetR family transcriptional regulator [Virgibacillus salarius]NAZ09594.1 TetR family transcriptional regulator [Agaribacter marinus]WBX80769.1 TetR/AcrR family transcriptional regulator [Virgibacillus salarius]
MPKKVDHEKRKIIIAEATWKIIVEEGIEQATVRNIAHAADLSVGALRHYFTTQSELLLYSMQLVSDRVRERMASQQYDGPPLQVMEEVLFEFIPLDKDRKIEMEVWLSFSARSLVDPDLMQLNQKVYHDLRRVIIAVIDHLISLQFVPDQFAAEIETERLYALIDGLAIHHLLQPDSLSKEMMTSVIQHHLKSLCKQEVLDK